MNDEAPLQRAIFQGGRMLCLSAHAHHSFMMAAYIIPSVGWRAEADITRGWVYEVMPGVFRRVYIDAAQYYKFLHMNKGFTT